MPHRLESRFTRYKLSNDEVKAGIVFTDLQRCYLCNLRADIAEQKLALVYTPQDPVGYAQQQAELMGQLLLLDTLISSSDAQLIQSNTPEGE